jgi:hypothetical protein
VVQAGWQGGVFGALQSVAGLVHEVTEHDHPGGPEVTASCRREAHRSGG